MNKQLYTTGDNTTLYIKKQPMGTGWDFIEHSTSHYYDSIHVYGYCDTVTRVNKMRIPIEGVWANNYRLAEQHEVAFFRRKMKQIGWERHTTYLGSEHEGLLQLERVEWRTNYKGDVK